MNCEDLIECQVCHKLKYNAEFGIDKSRKNGHKRICKDCEKRKYAKNCAVCGKEFYSSSKSSKCCSRACSGIMRRTGIEERCDICGKSMKITPYRLKRSKHHYCSIECMGKGESCFNVGKNAKNYKGHSVTYNCDYCGKESKQTLAEYKKYKHHYCSLECKLKGHSIYCSGKNSPKYDSTLTDEERDRYRNIENYSIWRKAVYDRDNYTCQCCHNEKSGSIVAHHLDGFKENPDLRTDVDNGITLCEDCHNLFHKKYGRGENTRSQFVEFTNVEFGILEDRLFKNISKRYLNTCEVCGKKFLTTVKNQRTCSLECKRILTGKSIRCICDICGKDIIISKSRYDKFLHHYCSVKCKNIGLSEFHSDYHNEEKRTIVINCDICGKKTEISRYRLKASKHHYCSVICANKGQRVFKSDSHPARLSKEVRCDICGTIMLLPPNRMKSKHHYCSRECQFKGQRRFRNGKD